MYDKLFELDLERRVKELIASSKVKQEEAPVHGECFKTQAAQRELYTSKVSD